MKKVILFLLVTLAFSSVICAKNVQSRYVPDPDPLVRQKLDQWQDLKFGLLMHWGTYSQWGIVESWSICPEDYGWCKRKAGNHPDDYFAYKKEYENLKTTFNPVNFNPDKWAHAARQAGMKYVIFTTKHHDGFCMFDSKYTDYKITDKACPFHSNKRANITREIFNAFRGQGFWVGTYFSKPDWHSPFYWDPYFPPHDRNVNYDPQEYPKKWEKFVQFTHNQIMELMSDYGKIDILWLDGGWVAKKSLDYVRNSLIRMSKTTKSGFIKTTNINQDIRMDEMVIKVRRKQPGIIVVDRAVYGKNQNYLTPENRVPDKPLPYPWESCIIAGGGWSWVPHAKYKSSQELIHMLVDIVCKGGNLLLNIAPAPDGSWDEQAYQLLRDIGQWMSINSQAIYKTRSIPPFKEGNICYTNKKNTSIVYAIYLAKKDQKTLPAQVAIKSFTPLPASKITLLGIDKPLKYHLASKGIIIDIPETVRNHLPCHYAWVFKINAKK